MLEKEFANLFQGLKRAYGVFTITGKDTSKNKITGKAKTVTGRYSSSHFRDHLEGSVGIGIVPINEDNCCFFGAIDIDVYEDLGVTKIIEIIRNNKLPLIPCTTKSGGLHLYAFFSEAIPAKLVFDRLCEWSILIGYPGVEVFPKQVMLASENDVGNWINIPYFGGNKSTRYALTNSGTKMSVKEFILVATKMRQSLEDMQKFVTPQDDFLEGAPPCLKVLASRGFPDGQRNNGLFNIACYLKMRYGDEYAPYIDKANQLYMKPPLPSAEVSDITRSVRKKTYFYKCNDSPIKSVCNKRVCVEAKFGIAKHEESLDVAIDSLTKIATIPPSWYISVNGKRMECDTTQELISQATFQIRCIETLNIYPRPIRPATWRTTISDLLKTVEVITAPEEASVDGPIDELLSMFIDERLMRSSNKPSDLLLGRPITHADTVEFRLKDFVSYLRRQGLFKMNNRNIFRMFRTAELEVCESRHSLKGKNVRTWIVKMPEIQTEDHDVEQRF